MKLLAALALVSSLALACNTQPAEEVGSSEGAASTTPTGSTIEAVFVGVDDDKPRCFAKTYSADHLARHPKQTVTALRVMLSLGSENNFEEPNLARVTFSQRQGAPKIRQLGCELTNGRLLCTEEPTCTSSAILTRTSTGLRLTNQDLRASGWCDETPKALDKTAGADDVFDLVPVDCNTGALADVPTVDCAAALSSAKLTSCIDVFESKECGNPISKGTRWLDEVSLEVAHGKRLESAEACIHRFSDITAADGCCGG